MLSFHMYHKGLFGAVSLLSEFTLAGVKADTHQKNKKMAWGSFDLLLASLLLLVRRKICYYVLLYGYCFYTMVKIHSYSIKNLNFS